MAATCTPGRCASCHMQNFLLCSQRLSAFIGIKRYALEGMGRIKVGPVADFL